MRRYPYALKLDVRKYFASIDHQILKSQLERVIKCKPTLALAVRIIAGSNRQEEVVRYYPGDDLFTPYERRRGLPLGNQTSQFFANIYLTGVDRLIDERLRPGVWARYVDDLVLFGMDKIELRRMKDAVEAELTTLRLSAHPGKSRIHRCADGVTFLGWRLFPYSSRLDAVNPIRFRRRLKHLQGEFHAGAASWDQVEQSVRSWIAHAAFGSTLKLRERIMGGFAFARGVRPSRAGGVLQQ
jgi:RNA-directed DNA polymerase